MAKTARPPPAQRLHVVLQADRAGSDAARPTVTSIRYTARRWVCSASMNKKAASDDSSTGRRRSQTQASRTPSGTAKTTRVRQ